jgi:hypothetical protein
MKVQQLITLCLPMLVSASYVYADQLPTISMTNVTACILTFDRGPFPVSGKLDPSKETSVSFYYYPTKTSDKQFDKTLVPNQSDFITVTPDSPMGGTIPSIFYDYADAYPNSRYGYSTASFLNPDLKWYVQQTYYNCKSGQLCLYVDAKNWCAPSA